VTLEGWWDKKWTLVSGSRMVAQGGLVVMVVAGLRRREVGFGTGVLVRSNEDDKTGWR
jgi:hypothetical protein